MIMKLHLLPILLCSSTIVVGQEISHTDSLEVAKACKNLFEIFENKDTEGLSGSATDKIYCTICSGSQVSSETDYYFDKEDLIENHFWTTGTDELFERSKKYNEFMLTKEQGEGLEITVFWTTFKPNEIGQGHEGAQFGLHFKKEDGEFKFAGLETVP